MAMKFNKHPKIKPKFSSLRIPTQYHPVNHPPSPAPSPSRTPIATLLSSSLPVAGTTIATSSFPLPIRCVYERERERDLVRDLLDSLKPWYLSLADTSTSKVWRRRRDLIPSVIADVLVMGQAGSSCKSSFCVVCVDLIWNFVVELLVVGLWIQVWEWIALALSCRVCWTVNRDMRMVLWCYAAAWTEEMSCFTSFVITTDIE